MRIVFIGAVKFSEQALNKLVEIKSSIVGTERMSFQLPILFELKGKL